MTHFDTLAYPEQQAETHAEALRDVVTDEVATKAGLAAVEAALKADIVSVKSNLKRDIEVLRESVNGRFRLLQWMVGFVLAIVAALLWLTIRSSV